MAHGPDAVHELVEESGWSYPVSARRLERKHALSNVQIDERGNTAMLGEILARGKFDQFEDREDLREQLRPAFEAELDSRRSGVTDRIKSIFRR